jgi:FdhD protein
LVLKNGKTHRDTAMVIPETTIEIKLNNRNVAHLICRPDNPEEPTVGHLSNFDTFRSPDVIKSIRVYPRENTVSIQTRIEKPALDHLVETIRSGRLYPPRNPAGQGDPSPPWRDLLDPQGMEKKAFQSLSSMAFDFLEVLELKGIFGAYHVAALADRNGKLLCQAGDVGMDITVDRVIGKAFLAGINIQGLILLVSGRLRAGLVNKAAYHEFSTIMTSSMVTHLALETARGCGIDIIHAKETGTLNIYSSNHTKDHLESAGEF